MFPTKTFSTQSPHPVPKHHATVPCPVTDPTLFSNSAPQSYCSLVGILLQPPLHVPLGQSPLTVTIHRSVSSDSLVLGHSSLLSLLHTSSVIVPSQPLPRVLRGQSPSAFTAAGRRPLPSSCVSVTVPSLSVPLGHRLPLAAPASHSLRCH